MTKVRAKFSFDHYGRRRRGEVFPVTPAVAEEMMRAGLVEVVTPPAKPVKQPARRAAKKTPSVVPAPPAAEAETDATDQ